MTGDCPKCRQHLAVPVDICPRCGVIFSRIRSKEAAASASADLPSPASYGVWGVLLEARSGQSAVVIVVKAAFLLGLAAWGLRFVSQPIAGNAAGESILHLVNLPFHEAGHVLFAPFGRFIQILGGTLMQLILPAVVAASFIFQRQPYAASVGLWWLGENLLDIAPYIDDARAGQLMLLGGVTGSEVEDYHDWEGILSRLGMMQYDHALARVAFTLGVVIMLTAVCWGGTILWREFVRRAGQAV